MHYLRFLVILVIVFSSGKSTSDSEYKSSTDTIKEVAYSLADSIRLGFKTCEDHVAKIFSESTPEEEEDFQKWIKAHPFNTKSIGKTRILDVEYSEGPISREQFDHMKEHGYIPPMKLPFVPKELLEKMAADSKAYADSLKTGTHAYGGTNHLQWFVPSVAEFMAGNNEFLLDFARQMSGKKHGLIWTAHLIHVPKGKGKAMLHNDQTATSLWTHNDLNDMNDYFMNSYIALTKTSKKTSPLFIYPGTHKHFLTADDAYTWIKERHEFSPEEKLMAERTMYTSAHLPLRLATEAHAGEKDDYGLGMCASYRWWMMNYDAENIIGKWYEAEPGEMSAFHPAVMHGSELKNEEDEPRMSLVITYMITILPPVPIGYWMFNNVYWLRDIVSWFTGMVEKAIATCMYHKDEFTDVLARHYKVPQAKVIGCLEANSPYPDNEILHYVNTMEGPNGPMISTQDVWKMVQCITKDQEVEEMYSNKKEKIEPELSL